MAKMTRTEEMVMNTTMPMPRGTKGPMAPKMKGKAKIKGKPRKQKRGY